MKAYRGLEQDLAQFAIEAHGGLERWKRFTTLSAHLIQGGALWALKGKAGVLDDVTVTVGLRNEKVSHWPFGSPDRRSRFEPQRVALENARGEVFEELFQPRSSFKGHTLETPWSDLQTRILPRQADGHSAAKPLVVSIDLERFVLI